MDCDISKANVTGETLALGQKSVWQQIITVCDTTLRQDEIFYYCCLYMT